jgi:hypothetical protein
VPSLGFVWGILAPSPEADTARAPMPMAVETEIDPDSEDDLVSIKINWGDGSAVETHAASFTMPHPLHTYRRAGTYHATATSVPAGETRTLTFIVLGVRAREKNKRVRFLG